MSNIISYRRQGEENLPYDEKRGNPFYRENLPYYRRNSPRVEDFKVVMLYSMLGLGTATGLFFLGRHFYKQAAAKNAEKTSLNEGDPSAYAQQLKMAFDNDNWFHLGVNTKQVFLVFEQIPSKKMYAKVQNAYFSMYGKILNADLQDQLSSYEYNQIISLMSKKP